MMMVMMMTMMLMMMMNHRADGLVLTRKVWCHGLSHSK
jgi:hypothetical protein